MIYVFKDTFIKVVVKKPKEDAKVVRIRNELNRIDEIVKGRFEIFEYNKDLLIAYNFRSFSLNMDKNLRFRGKTFYGDIAIIGNNAENGDFRSLNQSEIEDILELINDKEMEI